MHNVDSWVCAVGRRAVEQSVPDEAPVFEETAKEYFADPDVMQKAQARDEPLGFGLELALLTPYVLAAVKALAGYLGGLVLEQAKDEAGTRLQGVVRRMLDLEAEPEQLDADLLRRIRAVTREEASRLGLADPEADLLTDAVVGALAIGPDPT